MTFSLSTRTATEIADNTLAEAKSKAVAQIAQTVGAIRRAYITDISGQQMIYQAKEAEAKDFAAQATAPTDLTPYPFIAAEVGTSSGATAADVAQTYLQMASAWRAIGAQIEGLRIAANGGISGASTVADVDQAVSDFEASIAVIIGA